MPTTNSAVTMTSAAASAKPPNAPTAPSPSAAAPIIPPLRSVV
jgi:hypothetical protein